MSDIGSGEKNINNTDSFSGFTKRSMKEDDFSSNSNTETGTGLFSCAFINKESIRFLEQLQTNNDLKDAYGFLLGTYTGNEGLYRVWVEDVSEVFYEEKNEKDISVSIDTWQKLKEEITVKRPDLSILGFYHVKPDKGSLLSKEDSFLHEKFFTSYWHVSYQFDPVKKEHAFYGRDNSGNISPLSFRAEGDEMYIALSKEERDKIKPKRKKKNKRNGLSSIGIWGASFALILLILVFANHYILIKPLKDTIDELEEIIATEGYGEDLLKNGEDADDVLPGISYPDDEDISYPSDEDSDDFTDETSEPEVDDQEPLDTDPPASPDPPADTSEFRTHTISDGDNLWGISSHYLGDGSRYLEIAELNDIDADAQLRVGETIIIPPR